MERAFYTMQAMPHKEVSGAAIYNGEYKEYKREGCGYHMEECYPFKRFLCKSNVYEACYRMCKGNTLYSDELKEDVYDTISGRILFWKCHQCDTE